MNGFDKINLETTPIHIIYTFSNKNFIGAQQENKFIVNWQNYGFLRVMCNYDGKIVAYHCATKILPIPKLVDNYKHNYLYAFTEYNPEHLSAIKFTIKMTKCRVWNSNARWEYNSRDSLYKFIHPKITAKGELTEYFQVFDNKIQTDCFFDDVISYENKTYIKQPDPEITKLVNYWLVQDGFVSKFDNTKKNIKNFFTGLKTKIKQ